MQARSIRQPTRLALRSPDHRIARSPDVPMDVADQLRRLYCAGFDVQTFERYPRHIGAVRGQCIALLEVTPTGLKLTGAPGWRMGEVMGVLVERSGRQVFQAKEEVVEAGPEKLEALRRFRQDLENLLITTA